MKYCTKRLDDAEMLDLIQRVTEHAPSLLTLLQHLEFQSTSPATSRQCPPPWRNFIQSLSCASPVCALIPPHQESIELIEKLSQYDITKNPKVRKI